jgi:hypothetical protein
MVRLTVIQPWGDRAWEVRHGDKTLAREPSQAAAVEVATQMLRKSRDGGDIVFPDPLGLIRDSLHVAGTANPSPGTDRPMSAVEKLAAFPPDPFAPSDPFGLLESAAPPAPQAPAPQAPAPPAPLAPAPPASVPPPAPAPQKKEAMRFFFDPSQRPTRSEFLVNETPSYIELETRINDPEMPGASYFYVIPQSETSVLVAACWGREPDAMMTQFSNPKFGKDLFRAFCEAYPIMGTLFKNGMDERYSDGALIRFRDPNDGEPKWSVATVVGNIVVGSQTDNPDEADEYGFVGSQRFLTHSRMMSAYELVGTKSFFAAHEYATNKISGTAKAWLVAKGAWQGYLEGLDAGMKWTQRLSGLG